MATRQVLTEVEQEFMEIVWEQGEATVQSVQETLFSTRRLADSTVRTMLQILERREGRTYTGR